MTSIIYGDILLLFKPPWFRKFHFHISLFTLQTLDSDTLRVHQIQERGCCAVFAGSVVVLGGVLTPGPSAASWAPLLWAPLTSPALPSSLSLQTQVISHVFPTASSPFPAHADFLPSRSLFILYCVRLSLGQDSKSRKAMWWSVGQQAQEAKCMSTILSSVPYWLCGPRQVHSLRYASASPSIKFFLMFIFETQSMSRGRAERDADTESEADSRL